MKTRITELFEIEHPIIQGGMHFVGLAEMAAALSNAATPSANADLTDSSFEAFPSSESTAIIYKSSENLLLGNISFPTNNIVLAT